MFQLNSCCMSKSGWLRWGSTSSQHFRIYLFCPFLTSPWCIMWHMVTLVLVVKFHWSKKIIGKYVWLVFLQHVACIPYLQKIWYDWLLKHSTVQLNLKEWLGTAESWKICSAFSWAFLWTLLCFALWDPFSVQVHSQGNVECGISCKEDWRIQGSVLKWIHSVVLSKSTIISGP